MLPQFSGSFYFADMLLSFLYFIIYIEGSSRANAELTYIGNLELPPATVCCRKPALIYRNCILSSCKY